MRKGEISSFFFQIFIQEISLLLPLCPFPCKSWVGSLTPSSYTRYLDKRGLEEEEKEKEG
jgi:hypothetical protein